VAATTCVSVPTYLLTWMRSTGTTSVLISGRSAYSTIAPGSVAGTSSMRNSSPVAAAAIGAHLLGGAGLVLVHRDRVRAHRGVTVNTSIKTTLTAAALVTTAYSGVLGGKIANAGKVPTEGGTQPSIGTPPDVAKAQQQLRVLQWVTLVLTGALVVLGAQQGEQQSEQHRPGERLRVLATTAQQVLATTAQQVLATTAQQYGKQLLPGNVQAAGRGRR